MKVQKVLTLFLSLNSLLLSAQDAINVMTVTVVPDRFTLSGTRMPDQNGNPVKGSTFGLTGYLYPGDYFDNHCPDTRDCGLLLIQLPDTAYAIPQSPGELIGRWDMFGSALQDWSEALASGGVVDLSTQVFLFKNEFLTCPDCKITTEGADVLGGPENLPYKRVITGSTTEDFRFMRGEVEQVIYQKPENENPSGGYNMTVSFRYIRN